MSYILKNFTRFVIIGLVAIVFMGFTALINDLAIWDWITVFFSVFYYFLFKLNFIIDIDTLWSLLGLVLFVELSKVSFNVTLVILRIFF